ncbi:MAG TPA: glycosyltransferase family 4 protein [Thermoanaerobaculia bacterium]|nr:glycosyltransferase family 4 protein [Thermoanaerobaculia bacterium]
MILAQGDELVARGHRVRMVTKGSPVTWRRSNAEWVHVSDLAEYDAGDDDFVMATFWLTVEPALRLAGEKAVHLCQGYEGAFSVYGTIQEQIADIYRLPLPKLVVARSLIDILRPFSADVTWIGQIVEEEFYRSEPPSEHEPLRVILSGQAQADLKGIADGYGAVAHVRAQGQQVTLVRVSPWLPAGHEPVQEADEYHAGLPTAEMTGLLHSCDVLLAPNHAAEGFGLPAAEAMASQIPCVLTAIPSYLSFDGTHDYALFAPERNPAALGEALLRMIRHRALRSRLRERGREVAEQFRAARVIDRMEAFFLTRRRM